MLRGQEVEVEVQSLRGREVEVQMLRGREVEVEVQSLREQEGEEEVGRRCPPAAVGPVGPGEPGDSSRSCTGRRPLRPGLEVRECLQLLVLLLDQV
jgi:hypothetical protein